MMQANAIDPQVRMLVDLANKDPQVTALWLYGSRARGDHQPSSDYDLAVRLKHNQGQTLDAITQITGLSSDWKNSTQLDLSLIDINHCPTPLAAMISQEGILLVDKLPQHTPNLYQVIWSKWEDWQHMKHAYE